MLFLKTKLMELKMKKQAKELLDNYDRVILACGSRKPRDIDVRDVKAGEILMAVDYLTAITKIFT